MSIMLENDMPLRTHENMRKVIRSGQGKDFSVHPIENAF